MSADQVDTQEAAHEAAEQLLRALLPRFYWYDDAKRGGGVLQALVSAIADQYTDLAADVAGMYDDVFIQTCRQSLVPYIGDGIGVTGLAPIDGPGVSDRTWVGRAIALRRGKGTLEAIGRACSAATGWAAFVQDGRRVTGRTQSVRYPSPASGRVIDLADAATADMSEPWSSAARTVSVAGRPLRAGLPLSAGRGKRAGYPGPQTVEVTLWRLQSYPVTRRTPKRLGASEHRGRAFTFNPTGIDSPLFGSPAAADASGAARAARLPVALTVPALRAELARGGLAHLIPVVVWRADADRRLAAVPPERLEAADLGDWQPPRRTSAEAVVDPRLGRLVFPHERPDSVAVSYGYGFSGELGGGPYGSASSYASLPEGTTVLRVARPTEGGAGPADRFDSLVDALVRAREVRGDCAVLIEDSSTYASGGVWDLAVRAGRELRIASSPEAAPTIEGNLHVEIGRGGRVELSGLTIDGAVRARGDGELAIEHCTLAPLHEHGLVATADAALAVSVSFSILGPVAADGGVWLAIADSIVDAGGDDAVGSPERPVDKLHLERATVLGSTTGATIVAEDCIFTGPVHSTYPEHGLIRSSFVPPGSRPPTLVASRPDRLDQAAVPPLVPRFTSTRWGDPGYCQLSLSCSPRIAAGATAGGEMGAFNWLRQPARFARLPVVLHEMLPAGVAASINYGGESMEAS